MTFKHYFNNFFKILITICVASGCRKETIKYDLGNSFTYEPKEIAPGIVLGEIYHTGNFAAFTDIAYFDKAWYTVFRVGTAHVGGQHGQIKVIKSKDAIEWTVDHIIACDSADLRDPKLTVDTIQNKLLLSFFGLVDMAENNIHNYYVSYSSGSGWQPMDDITYDDPAKDRFIFWRYTYYQNKMYSVAYRVPIHGGYATDNICLFENGGQNNYKSYKSIGRLNLGGAPNETTIRFDGNKLYFLVRTEGVNTPIGISESTSFTKVQWINNPLLIRLASPNFLIYKGKLLITGRDVEEKTFKFFCYDLQAKSITKTFVFPSGYETGYGGMSFNPKNINELFISYYSITSNKSYINLAKVDLKTVLN